MKNNKWMKSSLNVAQKLCNPRIIGDIVGLSNLIWHTDKLVGYCCLLWRPQWGDWGLNRGAGRVGGREGWRDGGEQGGQEGVELVTIGRSPNFQSHLDNIISLLFGATIFSGKTTTCPKYHIPTALGEKYNLPFYKIAFQLRFDISVN